MQSNHNYSPMERRRPKLMCDRCDRILYSKSSRIKSLHYKRYECTVSDHRPISAAFGLTLKAVDWERMKRTREDVRGEWAKREADILGKIEGAYKDLL